MKNVLLGAVIVALAVVVGVAVNENGALGSVIQSQEYESVYLDSNDASGTATTQVKTGWGSLGSVIVASTTNSGYINLYDATSTEATSTANLIATFDAQATVGTYQFDLIFTQGLKADIPAFAGAYVLTYR